MATNHLHLFASNNGFEMHKQRYYGVYNGYFVCINQEANCFVYYFNTKIEQLDSFNQILEHNSQDYNVVLFRYTEPILSVMCRDINIKRTLDSITGLLKMCEATDSGLCPFCGEKVTDKTLFEVDNVICFGHEKCFNRFKYLVNKRIMDREMIEVPPSKVFGYSFLIGLLIFGIIALVYLLTNSMSWFYYLVGAFAMGYGMSFFYNRNRGKSGTPCYVMCMLLSLIFLFFDQAIMQINLIMPDFNIFTGIDVFLKSWLNMAAVLEMLLPQLMLGLLSAFFGIFVQDYRRIAFIKDNTIRINKI